MDGRAATTAALAVAMIGVAAFLLLDGMAAGAALLAAGVLLVLIGILGWQEPRNGAARASGGALAVDVAQAGSSVGAAGPEPDRGASASGTALAAVATSAVISDTPIDEEPFAGDGSADTVRIGDELTAPFGPFTSDAEGAGRADHGHDQPILNHSDLAAHVRDQHEGVSTTGSTIQLRLLHEREHGAKA
jgi:hypothetical protein